MKYRVQILMPNTQDKYFDTLEELLEFTKDIEAPYRQQIKVKHNYIPLGTPDVENENLVESHELYIDCLHDAQAHCSCGWSITCTGERSKEFLQQEYNKHL